MNWYLSKKMNGINNKTFFFEVQVNMAQKDDKSLINIILYIKYIILYIIFN